MTITMPERANHLAPVASEQQVPLEDVEYELCSLAGQIAAATARFLTLLSDFDTRRGWAGDGIKSCAHWLSWRCGLSLGTARDQVRVAHRLERLPLTAAEFAQGRLSYSKVRAICRVATPATESDLVHAGLHAPAAHLEALVRALTHIGVDDDGHDRVVGRGEPDRSLLRAQWRWDDDGCLVMEARLSPEDGAMLLAAAQATAVALHSTSTLDGGGDEPPDPVVNIRGATSGMFSSTVMGELARAALQGLPQMTGAAGQAPGGEIIVHVDADLLTGLRTQLEATAGPTAAATPEQHAAPARCHLDNGPGIALETIEKMACDGGIRLTTHASDGRTLDVGRRRRRPKWAQLHALMRRDRGCAVPSCGRTRFLHAHHVIYWSRGGPTSMDNLILLCGEHHRLVHDSESLDRFSIERLGRQCFRFRSADGSVIEPAPHTRGDVDELRANQVHVEDLAIVPHWYGESIDTDWFIGSYTTKRVAEEATNAAAESDSAEPHPCAA